MGTRPRIIKKTYVPPPEGIALIRDQETGESETADLTVHRHDGKVVALEVQCSCGRTLLVDCLYDEPEPSSAPSDDGRSR